MLENDMIDPLKLLEYNQFLRHRYFETLRNLPWEEVVRNRGASFSSLRDIYLHSVSVLDTYINRIQGDMPKRIEFDDFDTIEKIEKYLKQVEFKANSYLKKVGPEELSRIVKYKQRDGSTATSTVENILIHIFQEETHHRGELITLLWQMDITPPHMGWNQVRQKTSHPIFDGIPDEANFYFVHSYYVEPNDRSLIAGETEYGIPICSVIARGKLIATQFHPEKSGEVGLKIYDNFIKIALATKVSDL